MVAKNEGQVVGFLSLFTSPLLHHASNIGETMELVVDQTCRSKGIGKILFEEAKNRAKETNCLQLEVCTNMLRDRAHKFYERMGMNKFHYRFSMLLDGSVKRGNKIGR